MTRLVNVILTKSIIAIASIYPHQNLALCVSWIRLAKEQDIKLSIIGKVARDHACNYKVFGGDLWCYPWWYKGKVFCA